MTKTNPNDQVFIAKLTEIIESNIAKENFGVDELARAAGMTSFTLRRKLHAVSKKSINQLIREVRLQKAMELLQQEEITASEVAYKVGFGSPAYFSKCFHEYFGYPPGEAKNRIIENLDITHGIVEKNNNKAEKPVHKKPAQRKIIYIVASVLIILIVYLIFNNISFESFSILPANNLKADDKSVAVFLFKNLSSDEENKEFAYGVTIFILDNLNKIEEISVINCISDELGESPNLNNIAKQIHTRYALTGNVQRSGDSILVYPILTDTRKNKVVWSKPYYSMLTDIFLVQSEIAIRVATELKTTITPKEEELISKKPTQNPDAYAIYFTGRYFWNLRTMDGYKKSLEYFEKAIALDSNYAEAYAGIADVYLMTTNYRWYKPTIEGYAKTKEFILKALELDNSLADAHATYGALLCIGEWKWKEAEEELQLAIRLNPNCQTAHQYSYDLMVWLNRFNEAREHIDIALKLNPISPYLILKSAWLYSEVGNYQKALEEFNKMAEIDSLYFSIFWGYFDVYREQGEDLKSIEGLQKALSFYPEDKKYADQVKNVYKNYGMEGIFKLLLECEFEDPEHNAISIAKLYLNLGEKEKAMDWLEKAMELRIPFILDINYHSDYDPIRNEPRFQALLDKMGLTPYQKKSK